MSAIYFAIPTNAGQAKISNAIALGVPLKIAHMGVGDGGGQPAIPNPPRHPCRVSSAARPSIPCFRPAQPVTAGRRADHSGVMLWVVDRCVGLYDDTNTLIAIANAPGLPTSRCLSTGSGCTQTIRMV